jgi:hypothetical protein
MSALLTLLEVLSEESGNQLTSLNDVKQSLLQPVLLQLLPHLEQVLADPASSAGANSRAGLKLAWQGC